LKTTYTEDEYVRDTQIAMTGQGTHGTFVHLYINGIYWGLYNVAERPDDGYGEAYFANATDDETKLGTGFPAHFQYGKVGGRCARVK